MSYPFFTRHTLRLQNLQESSNLSFSRWQWLLLTVPVVLVIVLAITSNAAKATRSEPLWANLTMEDGAVTAPTATVTLPLELPPPSSPFKPSNPFIQKVDFQKEAILETTILQQGSLGTFTSEEPKVQKAIVEEAIKKAVSAHASMEEVAEEALEEGEWHSVTVKPGDSLSALFIDLGLGAQQVQEVVDLGEATAKLVHLVPGQEFKLRLDEDEKILQELVFENQEKSLRLHREEDKLHATFVDLPIETRIGHTTGIINRSLFEAALQHGLSYIKTLEIADIFRWDIDFARDVRDGDSFAVLYEEHYLDGNKLRDGVILAVEFSNRGKTYRAVRFTNGDQTPHYYTPEGLSMRKSFLRSPVKFTRISSKFDMNRFHPVLHRVRAHKGTDYAALTGTPIKATGDGKVISKGSQRGYGNTIILQHAGKYSTLYAHMSRFAQGLKEGSRVRQGQTIGYVGQTGLATGPHLHYEFRIDGVHRDPLTVELPKAEPIKAEYKGAFTTHANSLLAQMELRKKTNVVFNTP